ncbi:MAG: isomerase [Flavobacteriales bacterium]|nr:isomerase [Flavobacteriales bacterium]|tara:strand:- start:8199 stop:8978 length:780 start_codon:yes stop_codon:yes gene_type:complete
MKLDIYQVDAFTNELFKGNPAMVVPLPFWISDDVMQNIAAENNLSETAFYVRNSEVAEIRWFTPTVEVDLCGHATLAAAFVVFKRGEVADNQVVFNSRSGALKVDKTLDGLELDFPATVPVAAEVPDWIKNVGGNPVEAYSCEDDFLLIYDSEEAIRNLTPDFTALKRVPVRGIICSSTSNRYDFVSRFFAPAAGIDEDPVTGSAHTKLAPYWAKVLKKEKLLAKQISKRGGELKCNLQGNRVKISGDATLFLKGEIYL